MACRIFEERERISVADDESLSLQSLYETGTSAGGQHPKAIIAIHDVTHEIRSGQVPLPDGYTYYILKFSEGDDFPYTQVEMAYYELAREAGITMMPSRLIQVEGKYHFLTERYDRMNGEKVHVQTLAAMNPTANSYESLFDTACRIGILPAELKQLFLLTVMNVLGGNVDDHNKNFSFLMNDDGVWHAAPAYDYTFSVDPSAPGYVNRHCMTVCNKNYDIGRGDLLELAKRYNIKGADALIEKAIGVVSRYEDYARQAGIDGYWLQKIKEETGYRIENMSATQNC